ncbi:MFS transporter [Roseateles sp. P5_E11]
MIDTPARTRWAIVLLLCACGVLAGGQFAKISIEFTRLQAVYNASPAGMGLLLSTVGVVGLLCGVVAGWLAPRVGYRRLLLIGLGGGALLSALQALLPPFGLFWASRVPEGAAHLAIMVATPTLLIHACAPPHRTAVMGLWATVVGLAFAVLAGLDRLLPQGLAPRETLAGHAMLLALAALAVRLWVADVRAAPAPVMAGARAGVLALHREVYADLRTALPGLAFFFYAFPTIALITFVPRFSGQGQGGFHTVLPLMATAGTLAAGWAARRFEGGLKLVRLAYLAFGAAALALTGAALMGAPTEALALLTLTCAGLGGGAASTLIPQLNPTPAQQARASGVLVQLGNLGSVSGPPLFAALADRFGLVGLAGLAALTATVALLVLGRLGTRLEG